MDVILSLLVPIAMLLCFALIVVAVVGSFKSSATEVRQREEGRANRARSRQK